MNQIVSQAEMASQVPTLLPDHWAEGLSNNQRKALSLLGQNVAPVMVASTLGVSESLISQFLAEPRFADEVIKLKLATLQKQTSIDNKYMEIEDKMLDKLLKVVPLITKPMDLIRGLQTINSTKRRGMAEGAPATAATQIVQITLPEMFVAKFVTNSQNQVVEVQNGNESRSLITATPLSLDRLAAEVVRSTEEIEGVSWQGSASSEHLIQQASERIAEQGVSETIPKGLRRSIEAQSKIAADDL